MSHSPLNRIGFLIKKSKKTAGKISKKFFYIDNNGILFYTKDNQSVKDFLEIIDSKLNYTDEFYTNLIFEKSDSIKSLSLSDCHVSNKKKFLEDNFEKFQLKNRSYFDLFLKEKALFNPMIISIREEVIDSLREFLMNIPSLNEINSLSDQFRKYSENNTSKISEFDSQNLQKEENLSKNNSSIKKEKQETTNNNFSFKDINKFYFNNNSGININSNSTESYNKNIIPEENFSPDRDSKFHNKNTHNMIHNSNIEFKTGIDNLNNKFNYNSNFNEDDYSSFSSFNNNNISLLSTAENFQKKIFYLKEQEKIQMENVLTKLEGKFVNQKDWEKQKIRILNPSSTDIEYEESLAELENGSKYSGHVKNNMPNGFGYEFIKDGIYYEGEFKNGKWNGIGTITNDNLDRYTGEFVNGCICGI